MMVVIPQTVQQAIQRDRQHALNTRRPEPVEVEAQRLRNAILQHRQAIEAAGPLAQARDLSAAQRRIMKAKHDADRALWAHLPSPAHHAGEPETPGS